jgi:hypothetical protein
MIDFARFGGCANTPDTLLPLTLNIADEASKSRAGLKIKKLENDFFRADFFYYSHKIS